MSGLESQLESVRHEIQETHKALAGRHKFSLANAESRRKRKRTRDNAQRAKQRKVEGQKKTEREISSTSCVAAKKL